MTVFCGSGEGCRRVLRTRGLCEKHKREIRAAWASANPAKPPKPPLPPMPQPQTIDRSDVFVADGIAKTAARAAHVAAWVRKIGAPVRAADAVKVGGLATGSGGSRMLRAAESAGLIARDARGSVCPGSELPEQP